MYLTSPASPTPSSLNYPSQHLRPLSKHSSPQTPKQKLSNTHNRSWSPPCSPDKELQYYDTSIPSKIPLHKRRPSRLLFETDKEPVALKSEINLADVETVESFTPACHNPAQDAAPEKSQSGGSCPSSSTDTGSKMPDPVDLTQSGWSTTNSWDSASDCTSRATWDTPTSNQTWGNSSDMIQNASFSGPLNSWSAAPVIPDSELSTSSWTSDPSANSSTSIDNSINSWNNHIETTNAASLHSWNSSLDLPTHQSSTSSSNLTTMQTLSSRTSISASAKPTRTPSFKSKASLRLQTTPEVIRKPPPSCDISLVSCKDLQALATPDLTFEKTGWDSGDEDDCASVNSSGTALWAPSGWNSNPVTTTNDKQGENTWGNLPSWNNDNQASFTNEDDDDWDMEIEDEVDESVEAFWNSGFGGVETTSADSEPITSLLQERSDTNSNEIYDLTNKYNKLDEQYTKQKMLLAAAELEVARLNNLVTSLQMQQQNETIKSPVCGCAKKNLFEPAIMPASPLSPSVNSLYPLSPTRRNNDEKTKELHQLQATFAVYVAEADLEKQELNRVIVALEAKMGSVNDVILEAEKMCLDMGKVVKTLKTELDTEKLEKIKMKSENEQLTSRISELESLVAKMSDETEEQEFDNHDRECSEATTIVVEPLMEFVEPEEHDEANEAEDVISNLKGTLLDVVELPIHQLAANDVPKRSTSTRSNRITSFIKTRIPLMRSNSLTQFSKGKFGKSTSPIPERISQSTDSDASSATRTDEVRDDKEIGNEGLGRTKMGAKVIKVLREIEEMRQGSSLSVFTKSMMTIKRGFKKFGKKEGLREEMSNGIEVSC